MLKLYKFRPLGDEESLSRAANILQTGKFWCSSLWDLNDPMEGIFLDKDDVVNGSNLDLFFTEKNGKRICSFSGNDAFKRPNIWGYYANGFKGVAIEVEIDRLGVRKVEYKPSIPHLTAELSLDELLNRMLTTKLNCWSDEDEYRFISNEGGLLKIGTIKAVHFGWPYINVKNARSIREVSRKLRYYIQLVEELLTVAEREGIPACAAHFNGTEVVSHAFERADIDKLFEI